MREPRIRQTPTVQAPYLLNDFPSGVIDTVGKSIVSLIALNSPKLEGDSWEQIFADAIGADWTPSNVGLTDVSLGNTAWSAKTVKASNPFTASRVRLISGRNSPDFSYGTNSVRDIEPNEVGSQIIGIWNRRLAEMRTRFEHLRTVVLIKSEDFRSFAIFEFPTIAYDPSLHSWSWNRTNNLEGHDFNGNHKFTWQPHGSQFTIIESVPAEVRRFKIQIPPETPRISREQILGFVDFDPSWVILVS